MYDAKNYEFNFLEWEDTLTRDAKLSQTVHMNIVNTSYYPTSLTENMNEPSDTDQEQLISAKVYFCLFLIPFTIIV